jgi:nitrite reductase/ring-hydroxylating ferredoxin subunit
MERTKKFGWHKVANHLDEINFSANGMTEVKVGNKFFCIVLHKGILSACTQKCPHAGGILSAGFIDAVGNIVCPLHRYKFSLQNGRNVSGEGYFLKTFPIEIRNEGVFIGVEENNLLNWLK